VFSPEREEGEGGKSPPGKSQKSRCFEVALFIPRKEEAKRKETCGGQKKREGFLSNFGNIFSPTKKFYVEKKYFKVVLDGLMVHTIFFCTSPTN